MVTCAIGSTPLPVRGPEDKRRGGWLTAEPLRGIILLMGKKRKKCEEYVTFHKEMLLYLKKQPKKQAFGR